MKALQKRHGAGSTPHCFIKLDLCSRHRRHPSSRIKNNATKQFALHVTQIIIFFVMTLLCTMHYQIDQYERETSAHFIRSPVNNRF